MHRFLAVGSAAATAVAAAVTPVLAGDSIPQGDITIELEPVAAGLTSPVKVTHAGDGSGRLFIVEQSGQIRVVQDGVLLPQPFLDIADRLVDLSAFFDERGLLGLAFHPDYASNGRFFVRYSAPRTGAPGEPCSDPDAFIAGCHRAVLAEYHVSADDPNVADHDSEIILFTYDEPQFNHNAGDLSFGADGFLYFSLGDGGGANDGLADVPPTHGPFGNGPNIGTPLGALLRIDVNGGGSGGGGDDDGFPGGGPHGGFPGRGPHGGFPGQGPPDDIPGQGPGHGNGHDDDDDGGTGVYLAQTCAFLLDGGQEVPPTDSSGSALACVNVDLEAMQLAWVIPYQGLTSDVIGAHFHGPAGADENAGIVISIGADGLDSPLAGAVAITPAQAEQLLAGQWYVNIHTEQNPSGEIRGQVSTCVDANVAPPPRLYGIPADNPFVGAPGRDEIYAYGFRNPFRFSFDDGPGGDGSLYLADVGQNLFEEINIVERGANYGWSVREGLSCFDPLNPTLPPAMCADTGLLGEPLVDPIVDYDHTEGISVIGGFVYRGADVPDLQGHYVFGDFSTDFGAPQGRLFYLESGPGGAEIRELVIGAMNRPYGLFLKGFGEDEAGNVYVCGSAALAPFGAEGVVERITAAAAPGDGAVEAVLQALQGTTAGTR